MADGGMRGIVCPFGTLPAMMGKLAKGLVYLAYGMVVVLVFGLSAYTSFSLFVRSGVTTVPEVGARPRFEANSVRPSRLAVTICVPFCPDGVRQAIRFATGS